MNFIWLLNIFICATVLFLSMHQDVEAGNKNVDYKIDEKQPDEKNRICERNVTKVKQQFNLAFDEVIT